MNRRRFPYIDEANVFVCYINDHTPTLIIHLCASCQALEEKRRREILMKKLNRTRSKSKKVEEKKDDSDGKSVMEKSLDEMTAMDVRFHLIE